MVYSGCTTRNPALSSRQLSQYPNPKPRHPATMCWLVYHPGGLNGVALITEGKHKGRPVDRRNNGGLEYGRSWKVSLQQAQNEEKLRFCFACCCLPCAIYDIRSVLIKSEGMHYSCCQGFMPFGCWLGEKRMSSLVYKYNYRCCQMLEPRWAKQSRYCEENCFMGSSCCGTNGLILESCCCPCCALGSTRAFMMEQRRIKPDPVDNALLKIFHKRAERMNASACCGVYVCCCGSATADAADAEEKEQQKSGLFQCFGCFRYCCVYPCVLCWYSLFPLAYLSLGPWMVAQMWHEHNAEQTLVLVVLLTITFPLCIIL